MKAFFFRSFALLIRFLCPIVALALSGAEMMGEYYLFISYFTFVVGISALELAVPFSRRYLRCKNEKERQLVFDSFVLNQAVVSSALAIPAGLFVSNLTNVPEMLVPLFCLFLAAEACVNEVGRFFWNIGEWHMPSARDLIRSVIFAAAIISSIYFEKKVLTLITFLIILIGNLSILSFDCKRWGGGWPHGIKVSRLIKRVWFRVKQSLTGTFPQYVQMQLLGLQPLLERTLVDNVLGLAAVGAFSFFTSVTQSAAGLLLVPMIARARQLLLGARTNVDRIIANQQILLLLCKVLIFSGVLAFVVYLALPLLMLLMGKSIPASFWIILVAYVSSVSSIFCAAIAPLLTSNKYALLANGLTLLAMAPLLIVQLMHPWVNFGNFVLIFIGIVSIMQLSGRVLFIRRNSILTGLST